MNKELIINPNGTALIHETVSQERELANNTYEILQTENTIEELNDLLKNERSSKKI